MDRPDLDVKQHWIDACSTLHIPQNSTDQFLDIITTKYSDSQRFYHTLDHIKDMLTHFDSVKDRLQQPALVAMAIFFHDVIYEPREKDNEEKSAKLFQTFIQQVVSGLKNAGDLETESQPVVDWILATKGHQTEVNLTPDLYGDTDLHYLLDMDMAVLGRSPQGYRDYAKQIRQEYSHYSEEAYRKGRAKVLESFLKTPNIYCTKYFRHKYESNARSNIQTEITHLLQGLD